MYEPQLESIARSLAETGFPKKVAVEITSECNLRCAMCHHATMRRPKGLIPMPLWQRCADEIAAIAPRTECWFSFIGEPFLAPQTLLEVLRYGKSVGLERMNVNTNGVYMTPDLADPLIDAGAHLVVIGLDAFTAETYAKIRVGGDRDLVYANVEHLLARRRERGTGPEVQVQFIEMDENAHEIAAFRAWWLARGATVKLRNMLSWGGRFATGLCVPDEARIACPWAMTQLHVFWDGRVPRCPGDTEGDEGAGNAWHASLTELWGRLGVHRANHMRKRFDLLPERCLACKDWMVGAALRERPDGQAV
ncbi:MAG: radical SAM protein [Planctomycetes bacterium]|nr:radical SAM protein [Planctomycetota bacterium]